MLEHDVPLACQLCAVYRVLFSNSGAVTAARLCNILTRSMENGRHISRENTRCERYVMRFREKTEASIIMCQCVSIWPSFMIINWHGWQAINAFIIYIHKWWRTIFFFLLYRSHILMQCLCLLKYSSICFGWSIEKSP